MPLFGIAISHHSYCFCSNNLRFRPVFHVHDRIVVGHEGGLRLASSFLWKALSITDNKLNLGCVERWTNGRVIKAAATLEIASGTYKNEVVKGSMLSADVDLGRSSLSMVELQSPSEDAAAVDEEEKLRRMRISRANKGITPWNKGRKHCAETIQRIKERTKLAMQDPKMKMKMRLINLGSTQTEETKMKIAAGVRRGWAKRRQKMMLQETCQYEWQNLIAGAAWKGVLDEEELEWDSYETLSEQLKKEYLQGVEKRKKTPKTRAKGIKRALKSAEQKRKISEAVCAKWADPEYRNRVFSGLAKYRATPDRVGRKPRRKKPDGDRHVQITTPAKEDETSNLKTSGTSYQVQQVRLTEGVEPSYEDPFSNSKLDMLKNIQAQRAAGRNKKSEAVSRAKLLVSKAEAAAMALEATARSSRRVQAALVESWALIAKANQFLESIENKPPAEHDNKEDPNNRNQNPVKANGVHWSSQGDAIVDDYRFSELLVPDLANGSASNPCFSDRHKTEQALEPNQGEKPLAYGLEFQSQNGEGPKKQWKMVKKWIRGRLVEVMEEP